MQSLGPTCNVAACGFKAVKLLVVLGPLFRGDGPYVWTSWKNKNKKKTLNNQSEDLKNKARHLHNKNLASRETKLDRDTPSSYQFGKDVMKHKPASQMCECQLRFDCIALGFQTSSVVPQSCCKAVSCC